MSQAPTDPTQRQEPGLEPDLDAAQQSLSDALRVSFNVLKFIMYVLIVVYLFSGITQVDEQNTAVRYRFGEQVGTYGPGWYLGLPFPIEEVVMVPRNQQTLRIDKSFWYDNPEDKKPDQLASQQLDPLKDSFLITGDRNVVHVQFEVTYVIEQTNVDQYLQNVGSIEAANELVRTAAERGMIHAIASSKIDDIVSSSAYPIDMIQAKTQQVLTSLDAGITVQQVLIDLKNQSMPNQVREAYDSVTQAQSEKVRMIQEARRTYDETLGKTAGLAHEELYLMVRAYETALGQDDAALAQALRREMDRSIAELYLPHNALLSEIQAYQDASAAVVGSEDAEIVAGLTQAKAELVKGLTQNATERKTGEPIVGAIASTIRAAETSRTQIATQARIDYENYERDLVTFRKSPGVFVHELLQATRQKVLSGEVQTIVGHVTRINTSPDLESQEELAEKQRQKRLDKAREAEQNSGR